MKLRNWFLRVALAITAGFVGGLGFYHLAWGHNYTIKDESSHNSQFGSVHLRHEIDSFGMSLLDAPFSTIAIETEFGEILVYKGQVGFKHPFPHVSNVHVSGASLTWDDQWCKYDLQLTPLRKNALETSNVADERVSTVE